MNRLVSLSLVTLLLAACGGDSTAPHYGPPTITLINGVSLPTGLIGSTVLIAGTNFADAAHGKVLFTPSGGGTPIQATIANPSTDWTNTFIVATVPTGVAATSSVTVQTAAGTSNAISFILISNAAFSPSTITWSKTTDLPQPLQGLGAVFVPVRSGGTTTNYIFAVGGADTLDVATTSVYRATVQSNASLGAWETGLTPLPHPRAYTTVVAATPYSAPLDTTTTAAYLYVIGGNDSSSTTSTVLYAKVALDGTVGTWQTTSALPAPLHSASGIAFDGYIYLVGGNDGTNKAVASTYRAPLQSDGTLGAWQALASLPQAVGYLSAGNFGPFFYVAGGDNGTTAPSLNTASGTEANTVYVAQINIRDGSFSAAGWTALSALSKARSKHSLLVAGGALLVTSGVYSGAAGSSENMYASINPDGTVTSWAGATGTNTIAALLGYSLYNEAAVSFTDAGGNGHVLVLGGADRSVPAKASKATVYY